MHKRFTRWSRTFTTALVGGILLTMLVGVGPAKAATEYVCNPGPSSWTVVGEWVGAVMEKRICVQHDSTTGKVRERSYWRTRNGGTPVLSDWDGDPVEASVFSLTAGVRYGKDTTHADQFDTSFVTYDSLWTCSGIGGQHLWRGEIINVRANPNGSLPISGYKYGESFWANDSNIVC